MKITYKYSAGILMSLALTNWLSPVQSLCWAAERARANLAERIRVLEAADHGLLPIAKARQFNSSIFEEAMNAGLVVNMCSKVTSRTNESFAELRQTLAVESTEPQLLDFLGNIAASNSPLRIVSFSLRHSPDRSRMLANMVIAGDYRLAVARQSTHSEAAQAEFRVLSQRHYLRQAALDSYRLTKSTLRPGWSLEGINFQDGKKLTTSGVAPADQLRLLPDVRAKIEQAQSDDGKDLFSSGEASMHMTDPGRTSFCWSME